MIQSSHKSFQNKAEYSEEINSVLREIEKHINNDDLYNAVILANSSLKKYLDPLPFYSLLTKIFFAYGNAFWNDSVTELYKKLPGNIFSKCTYAKLCLEEKKLNEISKIFDNKYELRLLYPNQEYFDQHEIYVFYLVMAQYFSLLRDFEKAEKYLKFLESTFVCDAGISGVRRTFDRLSLYSYCEKTCEEISDVRFALNKKFLCLQAASKVIKNYEQTAPILLSILDDVLNKYKNKSTLDYIDFGRIDYILSLYLLAGFREQRAFPYIIRFLYLPSKIFGELLENIITESLSRMLISTYNGDIDQLKSVIENETLDSWARHAALKSLVGIFASNMISRKDLIGYFKRLYNLGFVKDRNTAYSFFSLACDIHPNELRSEIDDVVKNFYDEFGVTPEILEKVSKLSVENCLKLYVYSGTYYKPISNHVFEEMLWMNCFDFNEYIEIFSHIGRNELCPCGSCQKYKKCCIQKNIFDKIRTYA